MTVPSPANIARPAQAPFDQEVSYGGRPVMVYEQPETQISLDVAPGDPDFLIQAIDRDGQPNNFYGVPGLGIIDTTRSRAEGKLHWVAIFNPNSPDPDKHMYSIPIAGPSPESRSIPWMPYDRPGGGLSQRDVGYPDSTGFSVRRLVVDGTKSGRDASILPSRGTTDPFQSVREALNDVPGATDTLDRWDRIKQIYPDMRKVGQTALIRMVARRKGLDEEEVGDRIRSTGFY